MVLETVPGPPAAVCCRLLQESSHVTNVDVLLPLRRVLLSVLPATTVPFFDVLLGDTL